MDSRRHKTNVSSKMRTPATARPHTVNNIPNPETGKCSVAAPASLSRFIVILIMHICKRIIMVDSYLLAAVYAMLVAVVSVLTDIVPVPQSYFSRKGNVFNVYFVKLGWFWACVLLGSFIFLTSYVYCCGKMSLVKRHLSRLIIGTAWWWSCTTLFDYILDISGLCEDGISPSKLECRRNGSTWIGFDISGHAFILIYTLLMISEEVICLKKWEKIQDIITTEEKGDAPKLSAEELQLLKQSFVKYTPYIRTLTVLLTLMVLLWNVMLLSTVLYFHNMPQKLLGMVFAVVGWLMTYQFWYKLPFSPGLVGLGLIKYN